MDLADLSSLRAASQQLAERTERLDGLINNAGLMALPRSSTKDGFEMQLGTNHLGHFALTSLVFPLLLRAGNARVVTVSSLVHKFGTVVIDDLFFQRRRYDKWLAYGQSKLANLLFTFELDRRIKAKQLDVLSLAAHPGYAATELQTKGPRLSGSSFGEWMMKSGNSLLAQSQERGALPELRALTDPAAQAGEYYGPAGFMEMAGDAALVTPAKRALEVEPARALWARSVELTGEGFGGLL
jgi:protochlorophyllide reductase